MTGSSPSFVEVYGRGHIVDAAHGLRRNLHIQGLHALDIRTLKPDGQPWDFNRAADRREARALIEEAKPDWLIGSPPAPPSASSRTSTSPR